VDAVCPAKYKRLVAIPRHVFREYDIRGTADRDLSDELVRKIGLGLGCLLGKNIAVARDCRLSSDRLHAALVSGLMEAGAHVLDAGVGPTPMLYFASRHLAADGGVMITGSHNPADENGFKIVRGAGSFFGADIQALRERIEQDDLPRAPGGSRESRDVRDAYVAALTKDIARPDPKMKVVLDAGNGAGGPLGARALRMLGLEPETLYCEMDGRFPAHHPDPTVPKNLEALIARVRETNARVGLAYDGDADRLGAVDADGTIVWGDKLLVLFARDVLRVHPGAAILGEVKCSQTLYDDIARRGGRPIMWKTGHSLIKTKMKEEHALLAGEMSGHLFFADRWFGFDDAIYASLRLVELLSRDGRTIGEMLADLPRTFVTPELRIDCPDAIKFDVVARVTAHFRAQGRKVIDVDGARIKFDDGAWGLVRASNTGPVLVLRFEARTEAERDACRAEVEKVVAATRAQLGS
jgi:phosphomannomutase/phosphoglucomutase